MTKPKSENTEIMENCTQRLEDGQNTDNIEKVHARTEVRIYKKRNIYHSWHKYNRLLYINESSFLHTLPIFIDRE